MKTLEKKMLLVKEMTSNWLLTCLFIFKRKYKLIALNVSKQQVPEADPRAMQKTIFSKSLDRDGYGMILFIIKEIKEAILDFFHKK